MWRLSLILFISVQAFTAAAQSYQIKQSVNLPSDCFTQGFLLNNDNFYLSCGRYGHSKLYKLNKMGEVLVEKTLAKTIFAEGLSDYQDQLFLLTWKSEQTFPVSLQTLALGPALKNSGEGWGLTPYQNTLVQSDGSSFLYTLKLEGSDIQKPQSHFIAGRFWQPISNLNELELLPTFIASNVWKTDYIVFITRPLKTYQRIAFTLDLKALAQTHRQHGVLNGMAFDAKQQCLWVTGKMWPKAYALAIDHPKLQLPCNIAP